MSEDALVPAKNKKVSGKTTYFILAIVVLIIVCVGLAAVLGLGYKKFTALEGQLTSKDDLLLTLQKQQQSFSNKLEQLKASQEKLDENLDVRQQRITQQIDALQSQQAKNDIHQVAVKTDLYPLLLMAQYLPKLQAIALLKQVTLQPRVVNNSALAAALMADVKMLEEKPSTDWSGIYQHIELLHAAVPKLVIKEKPVKSTITTAAAENHGKLAELWQTIKAKLSALVVIERQGDEKAHQALQLKLNELAAAVMDLNQPHYHALLQKLIAQGKNDFKEDVQQQQWLKNLTWLKQQTISPTQVSLQSLKLLKQSIPQEGR